MSGKLVRFCESDYTQLVSLSRSSASIMNNIKETLRSVRDVPPDIGSDFKLDSAVIEGTFTYSYYSVDDTDLWQNSRKALKSFTQGAL